MQSKMTMYLFFYVIYYIFVWTQYSYLANMDFGLDPSSNA